MRYTKISMTDVIIAGAGAAGLMTAITAARRGLSVTVLEPNGKTGKKLRITGKGRCNVTNDSAPQEFLQKVWHQCALPQKLAVRLSAGDREGFF